MTNRYEFWTHSHTIIVDDPDRVDEIKRTRDKPLTVKQTGGEGWFGIPIVRPTTIGGKRAVLDYVRVYGTTKKATVDRGELRRTYGFIEELYPDPKEEGWLFRVDPDEDKQRARSLIFWVHVHFDEAGGEVEFNDAGAGYITL